MPRTATVCSLLPELRSELVARSRSQTIERRHAIRASVILDWVEGKTIAQSAEDLGIGISAVKKWRSRFTAHGLSGLLDQPRPGRPARISAATKAKVIETACSKPEGGRSVWSQREIAKKCGVSQSRVRDILYDSRSQASQDAILVRQAKRSRV